MKTKLVPLLLLSLLWFCGCGGGGSSGTVEAGADPGPVGFATLEIRQQVRSQLVPAQVDTVRITGFRSAFVGGVYDARAGGIPFPPRELALAPSYLLEDVPISVDNILIEYLDAGQVIGMYFEEVQLVAGQVYKIIDPAIATRPENMAGFSIRPAGSWGDLALAPPGEIPTFPVGEHQFVFMEALPVGIFSTLDYMLSFSRPGEFENYQSSELLSKFSVWETSDPSVATVSNGSQFNSSYRAGSVKGLKPGLVTVRARFFDLEASFDIRFVPEPPAPYVGIQRNYGTPETIEQYTSHGYFFDINAQPPQWERDVTSELNYRPSDEPSIADWDTGPGRQGHIIRGSQEGAVVLWARYPGRLEWISVAVVNSFED